MEKTLMWEIGNQVAQRLAVLKSYTDSRINTLTINGSQITSGQVPDLVLPPATLYNKGIVQLQDTAGESVTTALTPSALLRSMEELRQETDEKIQSAVTGITERHMPPKTLSGNILDTDSPSQDLSALQVRGLLGVEEAARFEEGDKNNLDTLVNWYINFPNAETETGAKTATEAGKFGQMSLTDDYLYICVKEGEDGQAKWKKILLTQIS